MLLGVLGWLLMRGEDGIVWWAVVLVAHVAARWIAFGWEFVRPAVAGPRHRLWHRP